MTLRERQTQSSLKLRIQQYILECVVMQIEFHKL
jgi:hypothetical protein